MASEPHSSPTRRSSDLGRQPAAEAVIIGASRGAADDLARRVARQAGATFGLTRFSLTELAARAAAQRVAGAGGERSEEHTSELQSRGHLVFRLLLEKKK